MPTATPFVKAQFNTSWQFDGTCYIDALSFLLGGYPGASFEVVDPPTAPTDSAWRDPHGATVNATIPWSLWHRIVKFQQWWETEGIAGDAPIALVDLSTYPVAPDGTVASEPVGPDYSPSRPVDTTRVILPPGQLGVTQPVINPTRPRSDRDKGLVHAAPTDQQTETP